MLLIPVHLKSLKPARIPIDVTFKARKTIIIPNALKAGSTVGSSIQYANVLEKRNKRKHKIKLKENVVNKEILIMFLKQPFACCTASAMNFVDVKPSPRVAK